MYLGFSDIAAVDQRPQFQSYKRNTFLAHHVIAGKFFGFESHNALDVGKQYHPYLRQTYARIRHDSPDVL